MKHRSHLRARALRFADLKQNIARLARPNPRPACPRMISVISAREPSTASSPLLHIDSDPAMARFAEANEVAANFFRGIDRQRVAGGIVFQTADENADDFALEIKQRRAGFTALRRQIDPQMRGGKIAAEIFPIETRDHSEAGRLRKIERITDRDHRRGHFQLVRFADGQRRCGRVNFEHGAMPLRKSARN